MTRSLTVAAAQLGPIAKSEPRSSAVARMVALMEKAHARGARLVVFPELALTTFFPRSSNADFFNNTRRLRPEDKPCWL